MDNPFRIGDVVYHPIRGKGVVKSIDESSWPVFVSYAEEDRMWERPVSLSFQPWPAPVHKRPFKPSFIMGEKVAIVAKKCNEDGEHISDDYNDVATVDTVTEESEEYVLVAGGRVPKSRYHFYHLTNPVKFD